MTMKPSASRVPTSPVRSQPSWNFFGVVDTEISTGDPRSSDLKLADAGPVARQNGSVFGHRAHLDAGHDTPGLDLIVHFLVFGSSGGRNTSGRQRAGLGHAPSLNEFESVLLAEGLNHDARHGRATGDDRPQTRKVGQRISVSDTQHVVPNRGYAEETQSGAIRE
jgi:hypothetical protein